jgi:hypothetical protein
MLEGALGEKSDVFTTNEDGIVSSPAEEIASSNMKAPETFEELPIEIRSLAER